LELSAFVDEDADQEVSWATLSNALSECHSLAGAYFFRVAGFALHSSRRLTPVEAAADGVLPVVYQLQTNEQYVLSLDAYSKSGETPVTDVIEAVTTSDKIAIQSTQAPSAGRSTQLLVLVDTAAVSWSAIGTLMLQGTAGHEHDAPRKAYIVALMVVLAVAAVLAGVSKGDFGLALWAVYLLKAVGGLLIAGAGFVALRRAPGVGK
jgi:hypothetical protein